MDKSSQICGILWQNARIRSGRSSYEFCEYRGGREKLTTLCMDYLLAHPYCTMTSTIFTYVTLIELHTYTGVEIGKYWFPSTVSTG